MDGLKRFFSDKYNILFVSVLILAAAIRIFLFLKYQNQPLWWDEADYVGIAKAIALGISDQAAAHRARGMAIIYSLFYLINWGEIGVKILQLVISVAGIAMTYVFGKKFFSKNVALVAMIFMSVLWVHLFWSLRISLGIVSMLIWLIAGYFFWKGFEEKGKWWHLALSFGLIGFGIFAYESVGFIIPFFAVYLLVTQRLKFLKNKKFWIGVVAFLVIATPFLVYNQIEFDSPYPRINRHVIEIQGNIEASSGEEVSANFWGEIFQYAQGFPSVVKLPIFLLFVLGFLYFGNMFLGLDYALKGKKEFRKPLFLFLWMVTVFLAFSFVNALTSFYYEPRFLMPMYPIVMLIAGQGLVYVHDFIKRYHKFLAIAVVVTLVVLGCYLQLTDASDRIDSKSKTFLAEPDAGQWLKDNTQFDDTILSCVQQVPMHYYSERDVHGFSDNLDEKIEEYHPKYIVYNFYIPGCDTSQVESSSYDLVLVREFLDREYNANTIAVFEVIY